MRPHPLVPLLGVPCALSLALVPAAASAVGAVRVAPASVESALDGFTPSPRLAAPGSVVASPLVVQTGRRALFASVDALLVADASAAPADEVGELTERVVQAARSVHRPVRTAPPAGGVPGLSAAVAAAGAAPSGGRLVVWFPGPDERRPTCASPGAQEAAAVADLVAAGVRVLAATDPGDAPSTACGAAASAAERIARSTGGATVPAEAGRLVLDVDLLRAALAAAPVQVDARPVCEDGLHAVALPDRTTAVSGSEVRGRWEVHVPADAPAGVRLSCVVVPHVDGTPALDAVHAVTVQVDGRAAAAGTARIGRPAPDDGPLGDVAVGTEPVSGPDDGDVALESVGEALLDVRRLRAELGAAVQHLASEPRAGLASQAKRAALTAVLDSLHARDLRLEERHFALAAAAAGSSSSPGSPGSEGAEERPEAPGPAPGADPGSDAAVTGLVSADSARRAVEYALAQLGDPYLWGATGPSRFDCSGLTSSAYAAAGVRIPRVSRDQFRAGVPVARDRLLPGDLVFFARDLDDPRTIHHVAMALGDGLMVHAPKTGDVVRVAPLRMRGYIGAIRLVSAVAAAPPPTVAVPLGLPGQGSTGLRPATPPDVWQPGAPGGPVAPPLPPTTPPPPAPTSPPAPTAPSEPPPSAAPPTPKAPPTSRPTIPPVAPPVLPPVLPPTVRPTPPPVRVPQPLPPLPPPVVEPVPVPPPVRPPVRPPVVPPPVVPPPVVPPPVVRPPLPPPPPSVVVPLPPLRPPLVEPPRRQVPPDAARPPRGALSP